MEFPYLFVPGDQQRMLLKIQVYQDVFFIIDLEDAVVPTKKAYARKLVQQFLEQQSAELLQKIIVRINSFQTTDWAHDVAMLNHFRLKGVMIPKVEIAENLLQLEARLPSENKFLLYPMIESAKGLLNSKEIVQSSQKIERLVFGSADYLLDINGTATTEGTELLFARSLLVNVSKAYDIQSPIDGPYTNFEDKVGFMQQVVNNRKLGMHAKLLIHPNQIAHYYEAIHEDLHGVQRVIESFEKAVKEEQGVIKLDGQMIDKPVYLKARNTLNELKGENNANR